MELKNLEPNKTYEIIYDLKGKALTDMKTAQFILNQLYQNTLKISHILKITKTEFLPDYKNRKQLRVIIQTHPKKSETLSIDPATITLAWLGGKLLVATVIGVLLVWRLTAFLQPKSIKEIAPKTFGDIKKIVMWAGIGILAIFVIPRILPKK